MRRSLASCVLVALAACSSPAEESPADADPAKVLPVSKIAPALSIHVEGQQLRLDFDPADHLRFLTCDLFRGVERWMGSEWTPLRDDLPGSYYQRMNFDGYFLDGTFVEPSASAGCDVVSCSDADSYPDPFDVGAAVEYVATGTSPPPADYEYRDPFVRPESVDVYESHPLHGVRVRSHIVYYQDATCAERTRRSWRSRFRRESGASEVRPAGPAHTRRARQSRCSKQAGVAEVSLDWRRGDARGSGYQVARWIETLSPGTWVRAANDRGTLRKRRRAEAQWRKAFPAAPDGPEPS